MIINMTSSLPIYPGSGILDPNNVRMIRYGDRLMVIKLQTTDKNKLWYYSIVTN